MIERTATCGCGQLRAYCSGEPARNSLCHCLDCKRRTGSAFSHNATYPAADVRIEGRFATHGRTSDDGNTNSYHHCPDCGSTVFYEIVPRPGMVSVPVGGFADPDFPAPRVEVYEDRAVSWCKRDLG